MSPELIDGSLNPLRSSIMSVPQPNSHAVLTGWEFRFSLCRRIHGRWGFSMRESSGVTSGLVSSRAQIALTLALATIPFLIFHAETARGGPLCTDDVMQCPDGSFVSRDPNNNCEFFPCPPTCTDDVFICPDGTLVSRDPENNCEFPPCPTATPTSTATATPTSTATATSTSVPEGGSCTESSQCSPGLACVNQTCAVTPAEAPATSRFGLIALVVIALFTGFLALRRTGRG